MFLYFQQKIARNNTISSLDMEEETARDEPEKDGEIEKDDEEGDERFFSSTDDEEKEAVKEFQKKFKN